MSTPSLHPSHPLYLLWAFPERSKKKSPLYFFRIFPIDEYQKDQCLLYVMQLIGFPFFESQAIWIAQLLSGKRTLPSFHDMMQSIKDFYHSREIAGVPKHNTHDLANFEVKISFAHCINICKRCI